MFITIEGPDGAGKTSVLNKVLPIFSKELGDKLLITREPGGNKISEQVRNVILDRNNTDMDYRTEALLYAAARRQHSVETILPALKAGKLVLCDRYVDSSVAYQGAGREIGMPEVFNMNTFATQNIMPNKTIYFDVPAEVGLQRIAKYRDAKNVDRLDVETTAFHKRVNEGYKQIAARNPSRIIVIDATQPLNKVVDQTVEIVKKIAGNYFKEP